MPGLLRGAGRLCPLLRQGEALRRHPGAGNAAGQRGRHCSDRTGGGERREVDPTLTISGAAADAAATGVRIKLLEMVHGTDVSGISFVSAFDTLDGVALEECGTRR